MYDKQGKYVEAAELHKRALAISEKALGPSHPGARGGIYPALDMGREGFQIAQWAAQSSAGAAVQQMALRFASGNNALAALIRDNQDLAAVWHGRDKALIAALGKPEGQQDRAATERLRAEMAEAQGKLAANTVQLGKEFPDYAARNERARSR